MYQTDWKLIAHPPEVTDLFSAIKHLSVRPPQCIPGHVTGSLSLYLCRSHFDNLT